jgi:hypothetical protein
MSFRFAEPGSSGEERASGDQDEEGAAAARPDHGFLRKKNQRLRSEAIYTSCALARSGKPPQIASQVESQVARSAELMREALGIYLLTKLRVSAIVCTYVYGIVESISVIRKYMLISPSCSQFA